MKNEKTMKNEEYCSLLIAYCLFAFIRVIRGLAYVQETDSHD